MALLNNGAAIARAKIIANALRSYFGAPQITELPASTPEKADRCLLANAFGFGCYVKKDRAGYWAAFFTSENGDKAEFLASALGVKAEHDQTARFSWKVRLPGDLRDLAKAFDNRELPTKYYASYSDRSRVKQKLREEKEAKELKERREREAEQRQQEARERRERERASRVSRDFF